MKRANIKKDYYGLKNVSFLNCDAASLPFKKDHFDLITSNLGINNFEHPQKVLDECFRVLKPAGEMIVTTNTVGHMRLFYSIYEEVLKELKRPGLLPELHKQEAHRKTAEEIIEMFQHSGFQIIKTIKENLMLRYLDGSSFFRHSLTVIGFLGGWRSILKKEDETSVFERLEEKLNEHATKAGELQLNIPMLLIRAGKTQN